MNTIRRALALLLVAGLLIVSPIAARATEALKVLGQSNPAATTITTLYTVPAVTSTVVSTIVVANQAATNGTFRISIQPACAGVAAQHYIAYDVTVLANDSTILTLGVTLATTDCIRVYASSATMSFNAFGVEVQ